MIKYTFLFIANFFVFIVYGVIWFVILFIKYFTSIFKIELDNPPQMPKIKWFNFNSAREEIYSVDELDGIEFEYFIAGLLKKLSYRRVKVKPASGDYGVDITASKDNINYAFQCKRYSSKVSLGAVQEVVSGLNIYNCDVGVVVTNNYFTDSAINLANANGVLLWDRKTLAKLIKKVDY